MRVHWTGNDRIGDGVELAAMQLELAMAEATLLATTVSQRFRETIVGGLPGSPVMIFHTIGAQASQQQNFCVILLLSFGNSGLGILAPRNDVTRQVRSVKIVDLDDS